MVAAYFENRSLKFKEIERTNKIMETVIKSLQSVEAAAFADTLPPKPDTRTFTYKSELDDWYAKEYTMKHQKYLAVRLQREKVEQIQKYLATYQDLLHNILSFNLFYSKSYSELTNNLPDPKDNLEGYINTLVEQISKNQADDDIATQRQLYIGLFFCIITLAVLIMSITVLMGTTIGLTLRPRGIFFPGLTLTSCIMIWGDQNVKNQRLDLIKNDCVPTINRHRIRLGTLDSELRYSRDILLYLDHYSKKIMCSVVEPTIYKETFELHLIDAEQHTALKSALESSSPFSDSLKTAVTAAIKTRQFSRVLPDASNNTKQPLSQTVLSDDRLALKSRFFSKEEYNAFNVEAVQNKISGLSS